MTERDPRKMALQIAGLRANETHLPENERVFEDPYAKFFFDLETRKLFDDTKLVKEELAKYDQMMPGVNGAIVARIRYIDDVLLKSVSEGLQQLVMIGAGYDTRAYRFPEVREKVRVFEVDHPVTQEVKASTIRNIFDALPPHVTYVPVVFGQDRLDQKLLESGYDPKAKTMFILEGLLMYIPPPAVDGLLAFIATTSPPGSILVADYFSPSVIDGTSPLKEAQVLRQFVESEGAGLLFGVDPKAIDSFFGQRGFENTETVSPEACKEKYFSGAALSRHVSPMFNFVCCTVAPRASG